MRDIEASNEEATENVRLEVVAATNASFANDASELRLYQSALAMALTRWPEIDMPAILDNASRS